MKLAPFALAAALVLPAMAATGPEDVHGNTYGTAGAPILIEVYSDFECPGCKNFHDNVLPQMMRDFISPGKAYVIYRYFPLPGHPQTCTRGVSRDSIRRRRRSRCGRRYAVSISSRQAGYRGRTAARQ